MLLLVLARCALVALRRVSTRAIWRMVAAVLVPSRVTWEGGAVARAWHRRCTDRNQAARHDRDQGA